MNSEEDLKLGKEIFKLGSAVEVDKRVAQIREFFGVVFEPEECPFFVSDQATIGDIYLDDIEKLQQECLAYYGIKIPTPMLSKPIWQVTDFLISHRIR